MKQLSGCCHHEAARGGGCCGRVTSSQRGRPVKSAQYLTRFVTRACTFAKLFLTGVRREMRRRNPAPAGWIRTCMPRQLAAGLFVRKDGSGAAQRGCLQRAVNRCGNAKAGARLGLHADRGKRKMLQQFGFDTHLVTRRQNADQRIDQSGCWRLYFGVTVHESLRWIT